MPAPRKATSRKKPTGAKSSHKKSKTSTSKKPTSGSTGGRKKTSRVGTSTGGRNSAAKKKPTKSTRGPSTRAPSTRAPSTRAPSTRSKAGASSRRRTASPRAAARPTAEGPQRLQKVLAAAGVASRRECEQLVLEGRVEVDRKVITKLGTKVDPETQRISVDGTLLKTTRRVYFIVNKPPGVVSTASDPAGRPRVIDMIPETSGRVFTVGRLDMASEGLILLTNDGELANQLTHPRYGVAKTYEVQVAGEADLGLARDLCRGIRLAEDFVKADKAKIKRRHKKSTVIEIILSEGKNREIRRMLARLGHKVQRLKRVAIGPLKMGELPQGHVRQLEPAEVKRLRSAVSATPTSQRPVPTQSPTRPSKPAGAETTRGGKARDGKKPSSGSGKPRFGKSSTTRVKKTSGRPIKRAAKPLHILKSPQES